MTAHWETTEKVRSVESKLSCNIQELRSDMLRMSAELSAKIDRRCGELERAMERKRAEERSKAKLIQWTVLLLLGNIVITVAAHALSRALGHGG